MLLIDAYNVLHAQWALPRAERGMTVSGLVRLVGQSRYADRRLRVICDGRPGPEWPVSCLLETHAGLVWTRMSGGAEVVFSGPDQEADDVIEDVLERSAKLQILLVSSDRRLIRAAGRAGADQVGNGTFLKQLSADVKVKGSDRPAFFSEVPLDAYSVAHWMREFGYDPGDKLERAPKAEPEQNAKPNPEPHPESSSKPRPGPESVPKPGPRATPSKPGATARFGAGLGIPELPRSANPPGSPGPTPPSSEPQAAEKFTKSANPEHEPLDPLLADAFEEWRGRLSLDDLDMSRWVSDVEPIRSKRRPS